MPESKSGRTPVHLWIIGVLALLWNALGAMDYLLTETRNAAYMEQFTPEQTEFFYSFPAWIVAGWAIAVWGGLLGAVLLLMRKKPAFPVLTVSFVAMLVTAIHNYGFSAAPDILGTMGIVFTVIIFIIALALVLYSRRMAESGVLR